MALTSSEVEEDEVQGLPYFEPGCLKLDCGFGMNYVTADVIKSLDLFSRLNDVERQKMGGIMRPRKFRDGEVVIKKGEVGDGWYAINRGQAKIKKVDPVTKQLVDFKTCKRGDFFGEAAQMKNYARGHQVLAHGALMCYWISKDRVNQVFNTGANSIINTLRPKRGVISSEPGRNTTSSQHHHSRKQKKDSIMQPSSKVLSPIKEMDVRDVLLKALSKDIALFNKLDINQKEEIVKIAQIKQVPKDTFVVQNGELGNHCYIITKGEFTLYSSSQDADEKESETTKELTIGDCFGEMALMYAITRDYSVKATGSDNVVHIIERNDYRNIIQEAEHRKFKETLDFLKHVDYLSTVREEDLLQIANSLKYENYENGQIIIEKDLEPESLYIIQNGSVQMIEYKEANSDKVKSKTVLKKGDFFGENCLQTEDMQENIEETKWGRTCVKCEENVTCMKVDPQTVRQNDSFSKIIRKQTQLRTSSAPPPSSLAPIGEDSKEEKKEEISRSPYTWAKGRGKDNIKWENLKVLGFLGKGSYGHVQLVQDKTTEKTYALKGVMKKEVVECNQVEHIVSEKQVMMLMDSPFILQLYATYKDTDCVYFLLEPSLGGELFNVLRTRNILDEKTAKYYVASVVLAFEYMQSKGVVYRDLKPENILLDPKGYAKVADFGFAKKLDINEGNRTYTTCGTPDYLAPEVILCQGHGFGFDWWCVGIFIYELLAGWPPFGDQDGDIQKTYENIINYNIKYPSFISEESKSIMADFLVSDEPNMRLGMGQAGIEPIKEHNWFTDFDWKGLISGDLKPPVNPKVKDEKDFSNFDDPEDGEIERIPEAYEPIPGENRSWEDEF